MAKATLVNKNLSATEVGALINEGKWSIRGARATVEIIKKTRGKPITKIYHVALPMLSVDLVVEEAEETPKKKPGRKPKVKTEETVPKKKPGRKPKIKTEGEPKKKPGRKPKVKAEEAVVEAPAAPKKKPGRKPREVAAAEEPAVPKKKPGRKKRTVAEPTAEPTKAAKEPAQKEQSSSSPWNTNPGENDYEF